jgi:hypothetical protein
MEYRSRGVHHAADADGSLLELDLTGAYPEDAGIGEWRRRAELRGGEVVVSDRFALEREVDRLSWSLMTPCTVETADRTIQLGARDLEDGRRTGELEVAIEAPEVDLSCELVEITDSRLRIVWGGTLHRIVLAWPHPPRNGELLCRFRGRKDG